MKKNKFLTFVLAIIPGCGHMYLGYMKKGAQFMSMFTLVGFLTWVFTSSLNIQVISGFFMVLLPIIWFFQMFDSMHLILQMRRLEIEFPEDDGFFIPGVSNISNLDSLSFFKKPTVVKVIAFILIFIGVYTLFINVSGGVYGVLIASIAKANSAIRNRYSDVYNIIMQYVPSVIISMILIIAGIRILWGNRKGKKNKKEEIFESIESYIESTELIEAKEISEYREE